MTCSNGDDDPEQKRMGLVVGYRRHLRMEERHIGMEQVKEATAISAEST